MTDETLRYPVGKFRRPDGYTDELRDGFIGEIEALPGALRRAVAGLSDAQLDTPYRPGGWTVRQVVHHLPDSHLNAYTRFKLALTEEEPLIRTYAEARWAETPEARDGAPEMSLALLEALHRRWLAALRALPAATFARRLRHPDWGLMSVDDLVALYAWHSRHHLAHVTGLRARQGW
jgi:uncharacterized damage-inducible protein DinB